MAVLAIALAWLDIRVVSENPESAPNIPVKTNDPKRVANAAAPIAAVTVIPAIAAASVPAEIIVPIVIIMMAIVKKP